MYIFDLPSIIYRITRVCARERLPGTDFGHGLSRPRTQDLPESAKTTTHIAVRGYGHQTFPPRKESVMAKTSGRSTRRWKAMRKAYARQCAEANLPCWLCGQDRKSTRLNSSHVAIPYA